MQPSKSLWVVLGLVSTLALQVSGASNAVAVPACSGIHSHTGGTWQPQAFWVYGFRGPVQARRDGTTCTNGGAITYIGISSGLVGAPGAELDQIGYFRWYDASANPPVGKFCLASEVLPTDPTPLAYACGISGTNPNDTYEWLEILEEGAYYYIDDCGVSDPGFTSCQPIEADAVLHFAGFSFAQQMGESFNATSPTCPVQIMGDPSDPDNLGSSSNPVKGIISSGDTWQARVTDAYYDGPSACRADYVNTVVAHGVVTTDDSRNTD